MFCTDSANRNPVVLHSFTQTNNRSIHCAIEIICVNALGGRFVCKDSWTEILKEFKFQIDRNANPNWKKSTKLSGRSSRIVESIQDIGNKVPKLQARANPNVDYLHCFPLNFTLFANFRHVKCVCLLTQLKLPMKVVK